VISVPLATRLLGAYLNCQVPARDPDLPFNLISPNMKSFLSDLRLQELKRKVGI
jgi:hypothetical protein